jgi:hypothetical protein
MHSPPLRRRKSIVLLESSQASPARPSGKAKKKGKAIPVADHGGPWGCETSRLPHFLNNRLTHYISATKTNL